MEKLIVALFVVTVICSGTSATTFTIVNSCSYTVWPGILSNAGQPQLENGGFILDSGQSKTITAPAGWSGRVWARTGCNFSTTGQGTCASGSCGGKLQCNGGGGDPPATVAEFTLQGATAKQDYYDVSLVDGYNLPITVTPKDGSNGTCGAAGCINNINNHCPTELRVMGDGKNVVSCKSACLAFGSPQYCCSGAYANPSTCKPSGYSQAFKAACPKAYSYAFDDPSSIFTCVAPQYAIIFCPSSSSKDSLGITQPPTSMQAWNIHSSNSEAVMHIIRGWAWLWMLLGWYMWQG